jgi:hypothetical protein|tara:strand:+ start:1208 stop:1651 length:444 start_codon:yes stop_codon:yes gene_type:complete
MNQNMPSMSRSRIDIRSILDAHEDASATDMMSYMVHFETVVEASVREVSQAIRSKSDLKTKQDVFSRVMAQAIVMGATDLEATSARALDAIKAGDRTRSLAAALAWIDIAEQSRSSNMMFFQACLLFGRAPNGKNLPDLPDLDDSES